MRIEIEQGDFDIATPLDIYGLSEIMGPASLAKCVGDQDGLPHLGGSFLSPK